ncbi:putative pyrroloquinoline-quinone binding quinoprotein [Streptomyces sp. KhCrAH-43]|uniref:outer membrane protein assembly factor BamB family protein n=1 Tax=unclassified Streptomyces TaxID=2593676 RepID=UPI000DC336DA|nr:MULTISPECIES: PQQ-binding-like beta-propeller repeat protein [unclassified Streptomyces]RAJ61003.1 putative pyrroloquinoline-quinone binding quinoprotein [Streptomyces sp. KhCrAH-43]
MSGRGGPRRWASAAVGVVLVAGSLAACGDGGGGAAGAKASHAAAGGGGKAAGGGAKKQPERRAFDPPVRFSRAHEVELTGAGQPSTASGEALRPAVTLVDGTAYVASEGALHAVDTRTGDDRWYAETKNEAERGGFGTKRVPPLVSEDGKTAYAAWNRTVTGEGTMPDRYVIEVLAVDTATGKKTWTAEIPSDPSSTGLAANPIGADDNLAPQVVGVDGGTAVVTDADTTYALDTAAGTVRWKKADFRAVTLADGVVSGGERTGYNEGRLLGLAADTGEQRWTVADAQAPAHAARQLLSANKNDRTIVVDAVDGKVRVSLEAEGWRCRDDAQALVACATEGDYESDPGIVVFDAASFRKKWTLPDGSGRSVPKVRGFWHGALYGELGGSSIVLDGATGKDRETEPLAAPVEIDRYGGVQDTTFIPAVG